MPLSDERIEIDLVSADFLQRKLMAALESALPTLQVVFEAGRLQADRDESRRVTEYGCFVSVTDLEVQAVGDLGPVVARLQRDLVDQLAADVRTELIAQLREALRVLGVEEALAELPAPSAVKVAVTKTRRGVRLEDEG